MAEVTSSRKAPNSLDFIRREAQKYKRLTSAQWGEFFDTDVRMIFEKAQEALPFTSVARAIIDESQGIWPEYRIPVEIREIQVVVAHNHRSYEFLFYTFSGDWLMVQYDDQEGMFAYKIADQEALTRVFVSGALIPEIVLRSTLKLLMHRDRKLDEDRKLVSEALGSVREVIIDAQTMK